MLALYRGSTVVHIKPKQTIAVYICIHISTQFTGQISVNMFVHQ